MSLFTPLVFRNGRRAPNRVALAPLTNRQSHADGTLGDAELHWLRVRAEGGFGILTTCAAHVARDGQGWGGELGCWDDMHIPGLRRIAELAHGVNALGIVQIFHGGLRADRKVTGETPFSASAQGDDVRAASEEDLGRVIAQFADAASRAQAAGLDGVELHGAHGYLLTQFLSTIENRRDDRWGGSLVNRARLVRAVTRAVRARVSPSFVVGVRLSPEDFGNAKGIDLDESLQVAAWLAEDGIDYLHVSMWDVHRNTAKRPDQHAIPLFRAVLPGDVRVQVAGKIWTRAEAEQLLEMGADAVALGRSAIANPDWPRRAREDGYEPRRPPLSPAELIVRGLSPPFVEYMRAWKGFVEG